MSAAELDDTDTTRISMRLQGLLSKLRQRENEADRSAAEMISSATADEIFEFIDNEIGRPFD